ncbi:MAG TPA: ABC transporter permease [Streptosporangiaceae bacterium]|nr:ABC transporter permease [Streptosporangiaceae bacterium]
MADRLLSALVVVLTSMRAEARDSLRRPLVIVNAAVQPVVYLLITTKVAPSGPAKVSGLVSAVVLMTMWSCTVWMAGGVLRRERTSGTLARAMCSTRPAYLVLLGKSLGATLLSLVTVLVTITVTVLALGQPTAFRSPGVLILALAITMLSGTALGMIVSCLFLLTRHGLIWSSALTYPVYILAGLLIPRSQLPLALRWIPDLISLQWIHNFVSASSAGEPVLGPVLIACGLTAGYFALAVWSINHVVTTARRKGSLDLSW